MLPLCSATAEFRQRLRKLTRPVTLNMIATHSVNSLKLIIAFLRPTISYKTTSFLEINEGSF